MAVVGSATVLIKAITTGMAKDIERGIKKEAGDVDVDTPGSSIGTRLGQTVTHHAATTIGNELADAINDETRDIDREIDVDTGRRFGDRFVEAFKSQFAQISGPNNPLSQAMTGRQGRQSQSRLVKAARSMGQSFVGAFTAPFSQIPRILTTVMSQITLVGGALTLFSPVIVDIAQTLLSYVIGLVAQLGFLTTAAIGAGAALAGVFGAAAAGIIPLILAFKTETPRLEQFKNLAKEIGVEFQAVGRATQRTLLPGLERFLRATRTLIRPLANFGREVGRIVGNVASLFAAIIESTEGQSRFRQILDRSLPILKTMGDIAIKLGDVLSKIFIAVLPIGEDFVGVIDRMVERFNGLLTLSDSKALSEEGTFATTLRTWYERAKLVFGALGDVVAAIFGILTSGADASVPLFDRFDEWAARFREFVNSEEGQNKLRTIFTNALAVMHEVNGIISEIFDGLFNRVGTEGGTDGLIGALQTIKAAIPEIKEFLSDLVSGARGALGGLGEAFSVLFDAFTRSGALQILSEVIPQVITSLEPLLTTIADAIGTIAGSLVPVIVQLVDALAPVIEDLVKVLAPTLSDILDIIGPGLVEAFERLGPLIARLLKAFGPLIEDVLEVIVNDFLPEFLSAMEELVPVVADLVREMTPLIVDVFKILAPILPTIVRLFADLLELITPLVEPIAQIVHFFTPFLRILTRLVPIILLVLNPFALFIGAMLKLTNLIIDKAGPALGWFYREVLVPIGNFLKDVFNKSLEVFNTLWGALAVIFEPLINFFKDLWENAVKPMGEFLRDVFNGAFAIFNGLWEALETVLGPVVGFFGDMVGLVQSVYGFFDGLIDRVTGTSDAIIVMNEGLQASIEKLGIVAGLLENTFFTGVGASIGKNLKTKGFASGGVITSPTLATLGEGYRPEIVLPLTDQARSRDIVNQVGGLGRVFGTGATIHATIDARGLTADQATRVVGDELIWRFPK